MKPLRVAVVGAESTGKSWLTQALAGVLRARGQAVHTVDEVLRQWCDRAGRTPQRHEQMAIAQQQAQAAQPPCQPTVDTLVRQALERSGMAYRVVYGPGSRRLNNALLALGLEGEDAAAQEVREQGQFAINQGRSVWQCNDCSDPACEHTLFTSLLAKRLN